MLPLHHTEQRLLSMLDHHSPAATITAASAQAFHSRLDQIRPAAQTKLISKSASWMLQIPPAVAIRAASTKTTCPRRETVRFGKVVTLRMPYCDLFLPRSLNFNRTFRLELPLRPKAYVGLPFDSNGLAFINPGSVG